MAKIKVIKPFGLVLGKGVPLHDFTVGEHDISDVELEHWYMQACIKEGRAVLVAEAPAETAEVSADVVPEASNGPEPAAKKAKK
jgi:hypothetical protein